MPDSSNKDSNDIRQQIDNGGSTPPLTPNKPKFGISEAIWVAIITGIFAIIVALINRPQPPSSLPTAIPTNIPTLTQVLSDTPTTAPTETLMATTAATDMPTETPKLTSTPTGLPIATNTPPEPLTPTNASPGTATVPVPPIADITSPANRSLVGYQSTIMGKYDPSQLHNNTLWIFIKSQEEKRFYPQVTNRCSPDISTAVKPDPSNGTWSADVFIGTIGDRDISKDFEIYLLVADPNENNEILGMFNGLCSEEDFPEIRSYEHYGLSKLGRLITVERE